MISKILGILGFSKNANQYQPGKVYNKWVIAPHVEWYKRPSILLSTIVVSVSIISSYVYLNYSLYSNKAKLVAITDKYKELKQKYIDLKTTKIKLERELEVAHQSQLEVKNNLLSLHQSKQELTEQVDLYKRIMSATDSSQEILVENVQVKTNNQLSDESKSNVYNLSLVLLQASKKRNLKSGTVSVHISGKLGDMSENLSYSQIAHDKNNKSIRYKFRDYQQVNKLIILPAGFRAESIDISVLDNNNKSVKTKQFSWEYLNGGIVNVAKK